MSLVILVTCANFVFIVVTSLLSGRQGAKRTRSVRLDFIQLVDKKGEQDKLISLIKEKSNAYLALHDYDCIDAIYASF